MKTRFDICAEVVWFNTATRNFDKGVVRGIQVVPTGISKDEAGNDVLDGYEVLYKMDSGLVLAESEVFASEAEARESYVRFFTGS